MNKKKLHSVSKKCEINDTHTLNVEIGGEMIQAEYFEFNSECDFFNSSFNLWDSFVTSLYRMKRVIRDIYYEIYYGFERMFKGYDSVDTFNLDSKFIDRYSKILAEFRKNLHGHPCNLSETEWDEILNSMIQHLYYMDEENVRKELIKDIPESWSVSPKTCRDIMLKHKDEFFKLFSEYFYDLWD